MCLGSRECRCCHFNDDTSVEDGSAFCKKSASFDSGDEEIRAKHLEKKKKHKEALKKAKLQCKNRLEVKKRSKQVEIESASTEESDEKSRPDTNAVVVMARDANKKAKSLLRRTMATIRGLLPRKPPKAKAKAKAAKAKAYYYPHAPRGERAVGVDTTSQAGSVHSVVSDRVGGCTGEAISGGKALPLKFKVADSPTGRNPKPSQNQLGIAEIAPMGAMISAWRVAAKFKSGLKNRKGLGKGDKGKV